MVEKETLNNPNIIDCHFEQIEKSGFNLYNMISQYGKAKLRNDNSFASNLTPWKVVV